MALGGRDVLKLIVDADSAGATKEFDKLGRSIKSTVGDADKQISGFKGKLSSAFDGLQAKSPMVSGIFDKMGVSSQQAASMIATAIPAAGVAAAAGIAAFAIKGVGDFQKVALAAGKFADASGLGVEQASRWLEVADHIGVSEQAVSSAFRRMGVAIGNNSEGWRALGVEVARNKDGSVDLSNTFLRAVTAIQAIEDPTKRAAAAQKLFGKGYAEVAELIGRSAPELAKMLGEVGDAKVINEDELARAREFRGSMDDLGDSVQELGMMVGQTLVPFLTAAANALTDVIEGVHQLNDATGQGKAGGWFEQLTGIKIPWGKDLANINWDGSKKGADETGAALGRMDQAWIAAKGGLEDYTRGSIRSGEVMSHFGATADSVAQHLDRNVEGMLNLGASADAVAENIGNETDALLALNDALDANLNATLASFDSTFALAESQRAFNDAAIEANTATEDQAVAFEDAAQEALKVADATVKYAQDQKALEGGTLNAKEATRIQISTLEQLAAQIGGPVAEQLLGMVAKLKTLDQTNADPDATLNDQASGPIATLADRIRGLDGTSASIVVRAATADAAAALDGIISRANRINGMRIVAGVGAGLATGVRNFHGGIALVGEKGPEIVHIPKGADVYTNAESRAMMSVPAPSLPLGGGGVGGRSTYITINAGVGDPVAIGRAVKQAIAAAERVGVN